LHNVIGHIVSRILRPSPITTAPLDRTERLCGDAKGEVPDAGEARCADLSRPCGRWAV